MALSAAARAELSRLRRDIADIEGRFADEERLVLEAALPESLASNAAGQGLSHRKDARLALGVPPFDAALGGGLPLATLHEVHSTESRDGGAASGFVLALIARLAAMRRGSAVVFISETETRRESGRLYAPGLAALGLDPLHLVDVAVRTEEEALWAFEAALSCSGVGAAICELRQASLDLSATRRCALRARATGVTGFLLRFGNAWSEPTAADLRFRVMPAPAGTIGRFNAGVGRMAWLVRLEKNRLGRTGAFVLEWNAHERSFVDRSAEREEKRRWRPHPEPLPAAAFDRSAHPSAAERLRRAS
jgi:protein ImuA